MRDISSIIKHWYHSVRIFCYLIIICCFGLVIIDVTVYALPSLTLSPWRTPYRTMCSERLNVVLDTDNMPITAVDLKTYFHTWDLIINLWSIRSPNTLLFPSISFFPWWMNTLYGDVALQLGVSRMSNSLLWGVVWFYNIVGRLWVSQTSIDRYMASNGTNIGGTPFVWQWWWLYNFVQIPCIDDIQSPIISSYIGQSSSVITPIISSLQRIDSDSWLQIHITEPIGSSVSYWWSGWIYTWIVGRTNQRWINSWSILISLIKWSWSIWWSVDRSRTITWGMLQSSFWSPFLMSWYGISWMDDFLDYNVIISGNELTDRGIENAIQLYIEARDQSPVSFSTPFSWNKTISNSQFNLPSQPILTQSFPLPWVTHVPPQTQIRFRLDDSWWWINTWSIRVQLSGVWYTWSSNVFSGSDISCVLVSWSPVPGGAWWYQCFVSSSILWVLPTPHILMTTTVSFSDLADVPNTNVSTRSWTTRSSCSIYQCRDAIQLYLPGWWWMQYTWWDTIVITWGNNPTYTWLWNWLSTWIIDCKLSWYQFSGLHIYGIQSWWIPLSMVSTSSVLYFSGDDNTYLALSGDMLWIKKKLQTSLTYSPPAVSGRTSGNVIATLIITGGVLTWFDSSQWIDNWSWVYTFVATHNTWFTLLFQNLYWDIITWSFLIWWIDKSIWTPYVIEVRPEKRINSGVNRSTYWLVEFFQSGVLFFATWVTINNYGTWWFLFPFVETGVMDIWFHSWSHLKSIQSSISLYSGSQYIDMTSGGVRFLLFGDFLWDNTVDSFDLWFLLGRYGSNTDVITDADLDWLVDSFDLGMFLGNYGLTGQEF